MTATVEVLPQIKIDTSLDLKVSRSDIINMIITEARDHLEAQLAFLDEQLKPLHETATECAEAIMEALMDEARAAHNKRKAKVAKVFRDVEFDDPCEDTSYQLARKLRDAFEARFRTEGLPRLLGEYLPTGVTEVTSSFGYDDDGVHAEGYVSARVDIDAVYSYDLWPELVTACRRMLELRAARQSVQTELNGLERQGKRAQATMIRKLLANTPEGQGLLGTIKDFGIKALTSGA